MTYRQLTPTQLSDIQHAVYGACTRPLITKGGVQMRTNERVISRERLDAAKAEIKRLEAKLEKQERA